MKLALGELFGQPQEMPKIHVNNPVLTMVELESNSIVVHHGGMVTISMNWCGDCSSGVEDEVIKLLKRIHPDWTFRGTWNRTHVDGTGRWCEYCKRNGKLNETTGVWDVK